MGSVLSCTVSKGQGAAAGLIHAQGGIAALFAQAGMPEGEFTASAGWHHPWRSAGFGGCSQLGLYQGMHLQKERVKNCSGSAAL